MAGLDQEGGPPDGGQEQGFGPAASEAMPSILGPDLTIVGDVESSGPVQIEGRVEGDVLSPSVTVGKDAYIDGSVTAEHVRILGAVAGWVRGAKVSLIDAGRVDGSIQHEELMSEGKGSPKPPRWRLPAALTDLQGWLLVRNLSLAVVLLLVVYFVGHSGHWAFVKDLPDFLMPVLGDQNVVAFLAFGFLLLLGYAWARSGSLADAGLRRRMLQLERQLALVRVNGKRVKRSNAAEAPEAALVKQLTERLEALEQRLAGAAEESKAQRLDLRVQTKTASRPRHRLPPQRSASS